MGGRVRGWGHMGGGHSAGSRGGMEHEETELEGEREQEGREWGWGGRANGERGRGKQHSPAEQQ